MLPASDHQKCIVHQIRNSVKHGGYKDLKEVCADLKKIYTAPNAEIGLENLSDFAEKWDDKYAYISRSWRDNWEQLSIFWTFPDEILLFERWRSKPYSMFLLSNFSISNANSYNSILLIL